MTTPTTSTAAAAAASIEIFRAGRRTDMHGRSRDYTEADLKAIAAGYSSDLHEAPLVVGHPSQNAPAYGWVGKLRADGASLFAEPLQVDDGFADLVRKGRFKKVSASFYLPDSPANPKPGQLYLRHVGFLGAEPPAVKGLRPVQFNEADEGVVEGVVNFADWGFSYVADLFRRLRDQLIATSGLDLADQTLPDWTIRSIEESARALDQPDAATALPAYREKTTEGDASMPTNQQTAEAVAAAAAAAAATNANFAERETSIAAREAALQAREQAARLADFGEFADGLVSEGRLLPKDRAAVVAVLAAIPQDSTAEFGEGDARKPGPVIDALRAFLATLPKQVDFSERAGRNGNQADELDTEDPVALSRAALDFQEAEEKSGRVISIDAAVQHVVNQHA